MKEKNESCIYETNCEGCDKKYISKKIRKLTFKDNI